MFSKISVLITVLILSFSIVSAKNPVISNTDVASSIIVVEDTTESEIFRIQDQSGFLKIIVID